MEPADFGLSIGHRFADPELLRRALTHRSHGASHNERLEYLGDSVLNCVVALELYHKFPRLPEGELSRLRANLVNQQSLAASAQQFALGERLLLGEGEQKSGGARRPSMLADAVEAVVGAAFLDGGFEAARRVVRSLLGEALDSIDPAVSGKDPKTMLQEYLQARRLALPHYAVVATRGEAHEQQFQVECVIPELNIRSRGEGASRRSAEQEAARRAGRVAIVGRPNVGKSTLLNHLVGAKVSITSSKPQTTRQRMTGIVTRGAAQIVFVDTPGYQTEHPSALNRAMNRSVTASLEGVDAAVWVVEALRFDGRDEAVGRLLPPALPVVLAINKTDAIGDRKRLLPFIARLSGAREFAAIVPVSATKGWQTGELLDALAVLLPEGEPQYDVDDITTVHERVLAAELLREKVIRSLGDELPYSTMIEIDQFKQEGELRRIHASIVVDKEGQKPIIIGKEGKTLKSIASRARREMEGLFGGKVFLEVWVKVRKGWADSDAVLRRLGEEG